MLNKYLVLLMLHSSAIPPAMSFECPDAIPQSAIRITAASTDWVPYVASPLYLHAAAPMDGPPEMKGELAEFKETRGKNEWSYSYALDGAFPNGKWLQCTYGEHNQVTLSRRLPDEIQACKFVYRKGSKAGQHQITIQCK
ncbi:hypothetical protein GJ699_21235 [Duganella sp. FT80W]|uniref:Uncharacterized protein n=1 Tax=Duganella guangzhouensis TaxID=2666084 RepID=A0A6I2L5P0_9BURK|nr:STY0301 family protein [Duganella guangzhouensis]MRW92527.1 hypothetical protein [Duganella guangzhouensis]